MTWLTWDDDTIFAMRNQTFACVSANGDKVVLEVRRVMIGMLLDGDDNYRVAGEAITVLHGKQCVSRMIWDPYEQFAKSGMLRQIRDVDEELHGAGVDGT